MKARLTGATVGLGMLGVLLFSAPVMAQDGGADGGTDGPTGPVPCNTLPNPIYVTGSSAFQPVIQAMALQLNNRKAADGTTPAPYTIVYQSAGSCAGVGTVLPGAAALTTTGTYYTGTSTAVMTNSCDLSTLGIKADVAVSDVFFETCGLGARPATLGDFTGPVQAMLIVVPQAAASAPMSITAEEAADVWACGAKGNIMPWTDETSIIQRASTSGTQNVIARSINVLAGQFHGYMTGSTGAMATALLNKDTTHAVMAEKAIGFVAADYYDTNTTMGRSALKALAFRGFEQTQAYYADSTSTGTFDKRNVRDGHYLPWGYEHLITAIDATGKPVSAAAKNFVDWVMGNVTTADNKPNFDPVDLEASSHVIPLCAMSVQRKSDGGFLSSVPAGGDTCNCFFETKAACGTAPAGCVACTDDSTCTGGKKCHHSYCE